MRSAPLSLFILLVCGCASVEAEDCRRADWYDLGFRDAIYRLQRQDEVYRVQCERHGVKVDVARYVQGWQEGTYEADQRGVQSQD